MLHRRTLAGENGNTILYHKNTIISENQHSFHVIRSSFTVNRSSSLSTNWHTTCYAVQGQPDNLFGNTCFIWILGAKAPSFCCRYNYTLHSTLYTLHPTHYTLHTTHYSLHSTPSSINHKPQLRCIFSNKSNNYLVIKNKPLIFAVENSPPRKYPPRKSVKY